MKSKIKIFIFVAISVLLVLISGCQSNQAGGTKGNAKSESQVKPIGFPIVPNKLTLTVFSRKDAQLGEYKNMLLWKDYEKKTNIHIEWDTPGRQNVKDRLNLLFSTQKLPDIILKNDLTPSQIVQYGSEGLIIPLESYIDKYAPNFKKVMQKYPDIKQEITAPDGHIYFLPTVMDYLPSLAYRYPLLNMKWLKKVGMQPPKTSADLIKVLSAFKNQDPNGKGNEIPYSAHNIGEAIQGIQGMFGLNEQIGGYSANVENGKVNIWLDDKRYEQTLKYFKELWDKKLVDPDIFTQTSQMYFGKLADGRIGYTTLYQPRNAGKYANEYDAITPPKGPGGDQIWPFLGSKVKMGNFMITKNNKHPAASMRWADYFFSDAGATEVYLVKKGEVYTVASDGSYHYKKSLLDSSKGFENVMGAKYTYYPGGGALGYFTGKQLLPTMEGTPMPTYINKVKKYLPKKVYTQPLLTQSKQNQLEDIMNNITTYADDMQAKFVLGKVPFSDWDNYVKKLDDIGIQKAEKILTDAINKK